MPSPMTDADDQRRFSNALRLATEKEIEKLTQKLVDGELRVDDWRIQMLQIIKRANIQQNNIAQGGIAKDEDFDGLKGELQKQWGHLRRFARMVQRAAENEKSITFAVARAVLYAKSTQAAFWQGKLPVKLPQVPRDGQTQCRTNCKCRLKIKNEYDDDGNLVAVLVWWKLSPAEHCDDCLTLARTWNPRRFEVGAGVSEATMAQIAHIMAADQDIPARLFIEILEGVA